MDLSRIYKYKLEEVYILFEKLSGSFTTLARYLKGEKVSLWTDYEDYVLAHPEKEEMYKQLETTRTPEEIKRRKYYIGIP